MLFCDYFQNKLFNNYIKTNIKIVRIQEIIQKDCYISQFYYKNNYEFKICVKESTKIPRWNYVKKILKCFLINNYDITAGLIIQQMDKILIFKNLNYEHTQSTQYKYIEF